MNGFLDASLMRPAEPFPKFAGTPTHVLVEGVDPLCEVYWDPKIVARRQQNPVPDVRLEQLADRLAKDWAALEKRHIVE